MKKVSVISIIIGAIIFLVLLYFADWNATNIWLNKSITELTIGELIVILLIINFSLKS